MKLSLISLNKIAIALFYVLLVVAFALVAPSASAEAVTQEATLPLLEILRLFMAPETALKWGSFIGATCYLITQILPWIPPKYLEKLHPKINGFIQRIAGNYRGTKNVLSQRSNQTLK